MSATLHVGEKDKFLWRDDIKYTFFGGDHCQQHAFKKKRRKKKEFPSFLLPFSFETPEIPHPTSILPSCVSQAIFCSPTSLVYQQLWHTWPFYPPGHTPVPWSHDLILALITGCWLHMFADSSSLSNLYMLEGSCGSGHVYFPHSLFLFRFIYLYALPTYSHPVSWIDIPFKCWWYYCSKLYL